MPRIQLDEYDLHEPHEKLLKIDSTKALQIIHDNIRKLEENSGPGGQDLFIKISCSCSICKHIRDESIGNGPYDVCELTNKKCPKERWCEKFEIDYSATEDKYF